MLIYYYCMCSSYIVIACGSSDISKAYSAKENVTTVEDM